MLSDIIVYAWLAALVSAVPCGSNWQIQCSPYVGLNSSSPLYQAGSIVFNGINAGNFSWTQSIFTSSSMIRSILSLNEIRFTATYPPIHLSTYLHFLDCQASSGILNTQMTGTWIDLESQSAVAVREHLISWTHNH